MTNLATDLDNIEPVRSKLARWLVRSYDFPRGKDRLFMMLRSVLRIPKRVTIELVPLVFINLDLDDYLQRWIYCHKLADEHDYQMVQRILREGDHFVDVGANIGIVSLIASQAVGESGMVYAVEALPDTRQALDENIQLNNVRNIRVVPFALLDEVRDVEFFASIDGNIGGSSMSESGSKAKAVMVQGKTFDSLIADSTIEGCDVLKMDIEGAESLALKGMASFFTRNKPRAIMIEVSDRLLGLFGSNSAEIFSFLADRGYSWYVAEESGFRSVKPWETPEFDNLWAILPEGLEKELLS